MNKVNWDFIGRLTEWRKNRIQNYAGKKGIRYTEALELIQRLPCSKDAVIELDGVCDPKYHSCNQPIKSINIKNNGEH